jgi:hypothetical protein
MLSRIPDQSLVGDAGGAGRPRAMARIAATRDAGGSYAFIYLPAGKSSVKVQTGKLLGTMLRGWWYNPRTGEATRIGEFARGDSRNFVIPTAPSTASTSAPAAPETDWVLVLDDVTKNYDAPGKRAAISGQKENR